MNVPGSSGSPPSPQVTVLMKQVPFIFLMTACLLVCTNEFSLGQIPTLARVAKRKGDPVRLGNGESVRMPCDLMRVRNAGKRSQEYYADVSSVACSERQCRVVTVRIYWDILGNYDRYEFPSEGNLTKQGHKSFTADDHKKLHSILSNPDSLLKWIRKDQLTLPRVAADNVDAVTGPTKLSYSNAVVSGAAYTCYTLWHWANGEISPVIREMTVQASDQEDLIRYLKSDTENYAAFGLNQLMKRGVFDQATVDAVIKASCRQNTSLVTPALRYLQSASAANKSDVYFPAIERHFLPVGKKTRITCLVSLSATELTAPKGYYDRISRWLRTSDSYYEVHLLLNLVSSRKATSETIVRNAMPLLEHKTFTVARRAFDFLSDQDLPADDREKLAAFREKYKDRL